MDKSVGIIIGVIVAIALFNIGSMGITQGIMEDDTQNTVLSVVVLVGGLVVLALTFKKFFPRGKKKSSDD